MGTEAEEYAKFEEKVKRTVCLDKLSPVVTEAVIKTAFDQYGNVNNIHFIPNYTDPHCNTLCALVELDNKEQATTILEFLSSYPFMMSGMPRPVRGLPAEPEMFADRPQNPARRKIQWRWLDSKDPDFVVTQNLKSVTKKHVAEQCILNKMRLEEEEKLSKKQHETLKALYYKYNLIGSIYTCLQNVGQRYGVHMIDD